MLITLLSITRRLYFWMHGFTYFQWHWVQQVCCLLVSLRDRASQLQYLNGTKNILLEIDQLSSKSRFTTESKNHSFTHSCFPHEVPNRSHIKKEKREKGKDEKINKFTDSQNITKMQEQMKLERQYILMVAFRQNREFLFGGQIIVLIHSGQIQNTHICVCVKKKQKY